jgi:microcystin-dependent protein
MATNFPAGLDSLTNPLGTDTLASPSHSSQHANANDAIEALQAKVGVDNSAVTTSIDYRVEQLENATPPESVPTGALTAFAGASAPTGWLLCEGQAVSRTTYSALFGVLSITYGTGDGSTTFNLPDLRSRFPVGKGTATWSDTLNEKSGSADAIVVSHSHTGPSHTHTIGHQHAGATTTANGSHSHTYGVDVNAAAYGSSGGTGITTSANDQTRSTDAVGNHTHDVTIPFGGDSSGSSGTGATSTTGSAATNANLPPYITLNYIIKT